MNVWCSKGDGSGIVFMNVKCDGFTCVVGVVGKDANDWVKLGDGTNCKKDGATNDGKSGDCTKRGVTSGEGLAGGGPTGVERGGVTVFANTPPSSDRVDSPVETKS